MKAGRTLRSSTERAFKRAFRTILAADIVVVHRRRRPVVADRGLGAGLRLLPRPVDGARRGRGLVLHPAGGHPAVAATGSSPRCRSSAWPGAWPPETPTAGRPAGGRGSRTMSKRTTTRRARRRRVRRDSADATDRRRRRRDADRRPPRTTAGASASVKRSVWSRLYHGETNIDFVGRRRLWFTLSLVAVADQPRLARHPGPQPRHRLRGRRRVGGPGRRRLGGRRPRRRRRARAGRRHDPDARERRRHASCGSRPSRSSAESSRRGHGRPGRADRVVVDDVNLTEVGPSWGEEITEKARPGPDRVPRAGHDLHRVPVRAEDGDRRRWPPCVHDILITVGVYSLTRLEVTPATVIAVLTILGYSIYDGIVVFDKVDENTRPGVVHGRPDATAAWSTCR